MNERFVIFARSRNDRLEIYMRELNGNQTFLVTHRFNPTLFNYLKNGRTIREVRAFRPRRDRGEKSIEAALRHAVRVADWLLAEEREDAVALAG